MADSANILSVLQMLAPPPGADAPDVQLPGVASNVLQQLPQPAPMPVQAPPPPPPPAPVAAPHRRRSLLDTIGRISDVLAKVGGAEALYQPTLDAREDRGLKLGDHGRLVDAENLKLATDKFDLGDKQNLRVGQAARGLKAIMTQNPNADVGQAWSALASQMQLDPATAQSFGSIFAEHPEEIDGIIASMTDPKYSQSKYGGSVVYGTDANGKLIAFQPSLGDEPGRNILPDGVTPIDPPKAVDLGNSQGLIGTRSGKPLRILPKGVSPDQANRSSTAITIAGMPARTGAGKTTGPDPAMIETAQGNLDELKTLYSNLNNMGAMVSTAQSTDKNVIARIRASGIGQTLEGAAGTKAQTLRDRINSIRPGLMQSLAKATGMTGKQLDSNADVKLFMQTVTDPTRSYQANIQAIAGLERFLKANAKKIAAPAASPAPVRPQPKTGWTIVGVK
jgi:hypothetical protein